MCKINYIYNTKNSINLLIFMGPKYSQLIKASHCTSVKLLPSTGLTESSNGSCTEFIYGGTCKSTLECCTTPKRLA